MTTRRCADCTGALAPYPGLGRPASLCDACRADRRRARQRAAYHADDERRLRMIARVAEWRRANGERTRARRLAAYRASREAELAKRRERHRRAKGRLAETWPIVAGTDADRVTLARAREAASPLRALQPLRR